MENLKLVMILLAILALFQEGVAKSYSVIKLVPRDNVFYPGSPIHRSVADIPFSRVARFGVHTIQRNPLYLRKFVSNINDGSGPDSEADISALPRIAARQVQWTNDRSNGKQSTVKGFMNDQYTIELKKRDLEVRPKRRLSINHGLHVLSNILGNIKKPKERVFPPSPRINLLQNIEGKIASFYRVRQSVKEKNYKAHVKQMYGGYDKAAIAQMLFELGK